MSDVPFSSTRLRDETRFVEFTHVPVCTSTQDLAAPADPARPEPDAAFWADAQDAGRGRQGRVWHGAAGLDVEATFRVSGVRLDDPAVLAAALPTAVADAIEPHAGESIRMKWPNDVYCGGRKLAGILIDAVGNPPATFLLGVGVNVNRTDFPPELQERATSLALLTGRTIDRSAVFFDIARAVDRAIADLSDWQLERLGESFRQRLGLVGRRVRLGLAGGDLTGTLTAIDLQEAEIDGQERVRLARVHSLGAQT